MARAFGILGATLATLVLLAVTFPQQVIPQSAIPDLSGALILNGCPAVFPPVTSSPIQFSGIDAGAAGHDVHSVVTRCQADFELIQTLIFDSNKCAPEILTYPGCQSGPNLNPDYPGVGNNNCTDPNCLTTPESADIFYDPALSNTNVQPFFATCGGLQSLVQFIEYNADYTYPAGTENIPTPGSGISADPADWNRIINVVQGDANLSQADFGNPGAGIVLVRGNLAVNGYPTYNGLILVIGTGNVTITGGGNGVVNGGIFLANTSTCPGGLGSVSFVSSGGGTFFLIYNSDAVNPSLEAKRRRGQVTSE